MYNWKNEFESEILQRGAKYRDSNKISSVAIVEHPEGGLVAVNCLAQVQGSETYQVSLELSRRCVCRRSCTCPYYAKGEHNCKHIAAVLFELESRGKLPFAGEVGSAASGAEEGASSLLDSTLEVLHDRMLAEELITEDDFNEAVNEWKEQAQVSARESVFFDEDEDDLGDIGTLNGWSNGLGGASYGLGGAYSGASDDYGRLIWDKKTEGRESREAYGYAEAGETYESDEARPSSEKTLEELLAELDSLVGLENIKQEIHTLINFVKINKIRAQRGLKTAEISYHLVFSGNPGTGKTTVARLLAKIYQKIGVLSKGHLIETDRSGLIAGYQGQTAIKTSEVIDEAMGGILFIDEAYSLVQDDNDTYGKESIATILKEMEDNRGDLIVIVAGYDDLMHKFIDSNPGLRSRFNKYFHFPDYTGEEMEKIFMLQCKNNGYEVNDAAKLVLRDHFDQLYDSRDANFGNGRDVRNIFENVINAQANRLAEGSDFTTENLLTLTEEDVEAVLGANKVNINE